MNNLIQAARGDDYTVGDGVSDALQLGNIVTGVNDFYQTGAFHQIGSSGPSNVFSVLGGINSALQQGTVAESTGGEIAERAIHGVAETAFGMASGPLGLVDAMTGNNISGGVHSSIGAGSVLFGSLSDTFFGDENFVDSFTRRGSAYEDNALAGEYGFVAEGAAHVGGAIGDGAADLLGASPDVATYEPSRTNALAQVAGAGGEESQVAREAVAAERQFASYEDAGSRAYARQLELMGYDPVAARDIASTMDPEDLRERGQSDAWQETFAAEYQQNGGNYHAAGLQASTAAPGVETLEDRIEAGHDLYDDMY